MKILLVEDDLTLAEEIVRLCRKWGFEAEYLETFEAVDREFRKRQADLILLDINLPFYDGFYWAKEIRKLSRFLFFSFPAGIRIAIRLWPWCQGETIMWKNLLMENCF